ncbi:uncharacterized protein [Lolium perenne]|jgi:hypothetical protein|uniref:uncharacterized protein n=1 Tax=Lolium perenne TaxID=4522 RepID=UPI0021EA8555|nr:RING-H2 finger protein ATL39-like [Lolium perenne]
MSTAQSPTTAVVAAAAVEKSKHWAPHGPALTACLVSINLLMILLIFFYFWRFFSGKRGPSSPGGVNDEEAASSADSSPATSPRGSRRLSDPGQLPVSVYDSSSSDDAAGGKAECAVCIVEFRDGDLVRLLPRCGHRFHAACVDAWLRLHSTCPLCRADVVAPAPAAADAKNDDPKDDGGAESPV